MSARILGEKFGLTAEQMNYVLELAGLQDGEPGAWSITEKGAKFAAEQHHHRGPGGYSWYNRYWDTVTWDESVAPVLEAAVDLSDDGKRQIRQAVSDARRARRLAKAALSKAAVAADISGTDVVGARSGGTNALALARGLNPKTMGAVLATAAAYGIYKAVPLAQQLFSERRARTRSGLTDGVQPKPDTTAEAGTDDDGEIGV